MVCCVSDMVGGALRRNGGAGSGWEAAAAAAAAADRGQAGSGSGGFEGRPRAWRLLTLPRCLSHTSAGGLLSTAHA